MIINTDGIFDLAIGVSGGSRTWKNTKIRWSKLLQKLSVPKYTDETLATFMKMDDKDKFKIKDISGGYVGGYLRGGKRGKNNVIHRQLITLDVDYANEHFWDNFKIIFGNAAAIHGTHKNSPTNNRYRLIMPLNREVTPDEYSAISRKIAEIIGIELFDNTTFDINRLMFWQSTPKDQEYYFEYQDGEWLDADNILKSYLDWKDTSLWATPEKYNKLISDKIKKQEDPLAKDGIIGAFCKAYTIHDAITTFLPDIYIHAGEDRYTYVNGTTSSGAIVYQDKFLYSHHSTDPAGEILCNAFDLVRIHKFGHLDTDARSRKSFTAMQDLASKDKKVKKQIALENLQNAKYDFNLEDEPETKKEELIENLEWVKDLDTDAKGNNLNTANNFTQILRNDTNLKGIFKLNLLDDNIYLCSSAPWRKIKKPEPIKSVDISGIRSYVESIYNIYNKDKLKDTITIETFKNSFHPIKDYLGGLKWDGIKRVDNLLIDFFGVDDKPYYREAIRKMLVGAVARIYNAGCKFDLVLVLVGDQGQQKSRFISKLGKEWFSDSFSTVQGREAFEQIKGWWIIEIAELAGFRKAEVEAIKHYITKQKDTHRMAYKEVSETYNRQCVFFGTTNNKEFLRDPTGNRRFLPVDIKRKKAKKDIEKDLNTEYINQVWAEAKQMYDNGENLLLSEEAAKEAKIQQNMHSETDDRKGIIERYLSRKLPIDWESRDIYDRRAFIDSEEEGEVLRDKVCIYEIWCECFCKNKEDMKPIDSRTINDILRSLPEWEYNMTGKRFAIYGKQKYYSRANED